jgi:hypothetical protein
VTGERNGRGVTRLDIDVGQPDWGGEVHGRVVKYHRHRVASTASGPPVIGRAAINVEGSTVAVEGSTVVVEGSTVVVEGSTVVVEGSTVVVEVPRSS